MPSPVRTSLKPVLLCETHVHENIKIGWPCSKKKFYCSKKSGAGFKFSSYNKIRSAFIKPSRLFSSRNKLGRLPVTRFFKALSNICSYGW